MTDRPSSIFLKRTFAVLAMLAAMFCVFGFDQARAETRSLKLYFLHTGEKAEITFKRNGRYDKKGLEQLNWFLRDWRRKEPTTMNPKLFDLVWEVYQQVGATDYINVVSAYRSPQTNAMLRKTSSGVAKKSQHMLGNAMDFFIPGVPLAKLRATAMKMQRGGVGYYPRSGSPFVHLDVASVRAWPRMSRSQLVSLFPEGHTLHLPADGKPLPGYQQALAEYKAKGSVSGSQPVRVASNNNTADDGDEDEGRTLLSMLFNRDRSGNDSSSSGGSQQRAATPTRQTAPAQRPVDILTAAVSFDNLDIPLPLTRPGVDNAELGTPLATALVDPNPPEAQPGLAIAANIPLPRSRPASLGPEQGMTVGDVLVADAAAPVEPAPVEVASFGNDAGFENDRFGFIDGEVPVPSPRLAYAGLDEGAQITPEQIQAASRTSAGVPEPTRDPRKSAHSELARKLSVMGETTEVAYNEDNDFRTLFRPSVARINATTPEAPVKGDRPGSVLSDSAGEGADTSDISNETSNGYQSASLERKADGNTNQRSIVEYFDQDRF
ncbi:DUF882 domain-containing protein [Martelella mangrovi]|uniref:Murein endopeptidase K n=1 Tax=Martelella mangrovi TaxID=1397477 RepID=A0ABV2IBJ9_9HYPH